MSALTAHSGPPEPPDTPDRVVWDWTFSLRSEPGRVWAAIIDSSRFNRAMGLPPMVYTEDEAGRRFGTWWHLGLYHAWEEPPWRWSRGVHGDCVRLYSAGPAQRVDIRYSVDPGDDGGTCVRIRLSWLPRGLFGSLVFRIGRLDFAGRYRRALQRIDAELLEDVDPALTLGQPFRPSASARRRVGEAASSLRRAGVAPSVAEALCGHILYGDTLDLQQIRPQVLARQRGLGARETLDACLEATRLGVLDLSWDILCPHCRATRLAVRSLGQVPAHTRCATCALAFGPHVPETLEVTFRVHPSVREVPHESRCLAETAERRHVVVQQPLGPGQGVRVPTRLPPGRYTVRVLGDDRLGHLDVAADAAEEATLEVGALGIARVRPTAALLLHNPTEAARVLLVEADNPLLEATLPGELLCMPRFQDLFVDEAIAAGVQLALGRQTVLFTDVVGSTALYRELGDGEAFAIVKRHFEEVERIVRAHRGAVVKTIGDAAMAAFPAVGAAVLAAEALQRRFETGELGVRLRVSLNEGPCLGVNLNRGVDYFGSTVNVAAKLQELASAGEVVFAARLLALLPLPEALPLEVSRVRARVAGEPEPIDVIRWRPSGGTPLALALTPAPAGRVPVQPAADHPHDPRSYR